MGVIFLFSLCLYELQRLVISVDDYLLPMDVMVPLSKGMYNRIHLFIIGGIFANYI